MKKSFAKFIALALVLIMALGAMPLSVMAEGEGWSWWTNPISGSEPYPEQEFLPPEADDVTVKVHSPEGALPEGTDIKVESADLTAVQTVVDNSANISGTVLAAVDITFTYNNTEVQPNSNVTVNMTSPAFEGQQNLRVVHITQLRSDSVAAEPVAADFEDDTAVFEADHFSVYAVVADGTVADTARLKVQFFGEDTVNPLAVVYINETQNTDEMINKIIDVEPEVVTNSLTVNDLVFCGWIPYRRNYTVSDFIDGDHDIDQVRAAVKRRLERGVAEGDVMNVYAMLFYEYSVRYVGEEKNGKNPVLEAVTLYSKDGSPVDYQIDLSYTPNSLSTSKFNGWVISGDTSNTVYNYNDVLTVSGDVVLMTDVSNGHWISFNEKPTDEYKGAKYVAPKFFETTESMDGYVAPESSLTGYHFDGWYTDANYTTEFNFTGKLTENKTLYAKWTMNSTADYTVIIWQQDVTDSADQSLGISDKQYDYVCSVTENDASTSSTINSTLIDTYTNYDGNASATIGKDTYNFTGFHYVGFTYTADKSGKVHPAGTTVVNVYYDRNYHTLTFKDQMYTPLSSTPSTTNLNNGGYYVKLDGQYYEVDYGNSNYTYIKVSHSYADNHVSQGHYYVLSSDTYYALAHDSGGWYVNHSDFNYHQYIGSDIQIYYRVSRSSVTYYSTTSVGVVHTVNALYGQDIRNIWNFTGSNGVTYPQSDPVTSWTPSGSSTYTQRITEQIVMPDENITYTHTTTSNTTRYFHYYVEALESDNDAVTFNGERYIEFEYLPNDFNIVFYEDDFWNLRGFTREFIRDSKGNKVTIETSGSPWESGTSSNNALISLSSGADANTLYFCYTRNQYNIHYMWGAFVDGNGNKLTAEKVGEIKSIDGIYFETNIDSYKVGGTNYFDPTRSLNNPAYVFEGWYKDPDCTAPFDFADMTMPANDIAVFAKFRTIQYRVFLRNIGESGNVSYTVDFNDENQTPNFRVNYGAFISDGSPIEATRSDGKILAGWYTDSALTESFDFYQEINNGNTIPYDNTDQYNWTDSGDDDNPFPYTYNADARENRTWITRKLDLYAKWVDPLPNVDGINVVYDAYNMDGTITGTRQKDATHEGGRYYTDPCLYSDGVTAFVRSASTADNPDSTFDYWELLDKNGNVIGTYKPGEKFVINADLMARLTNPAAGSKGAGSEAQRDSGTRSGSPIVMPKATTSTYYVEVSQLVVGEKYLIVGQRNSNYHLLTPEFYDSSNSRQLKMLPLTLNSSTGGHFVFNTGDDLSANLFTVGGSSSGYTFADADGNYLVNAKGYASLSTSSSSRNKWTVTASTGSYGGYILKNTNTETDYPYLGYEESSTSGVYYTDCYSSSGSPYRFYKQISVSTPDTNDTVVYQLVSAPTAGHQYVIVSGSYAVTNTIITTNNHYLSAQKVTVNSDNTITVPSSAVDSVLWLVDGSTSNGWTFYNTSVDKYMGLDTNEYLNLTATGLAWTYNGTDLNNRVDSGGYYYLSLSGITYFTTSQSTGNNIKFYEKVVTEVAKLYTVSFLDKDGNTIYGSTQTVTEGNKPTAPADPVAPEGKRFDGWTIQGGGNTVYSSNDLPEITEDTVFVAHFSDLPLYGCYFETPADFAAWTLNDADGDGRNWYQLIYTTASNPDLPYYNSDSGAYAYEGAGHITSASYTKVNNNDVILTPDNWAFSPAVKLPTGSASVTLYARGQDANHAAEHIAIYCGTSADPASMVMVSSEIVTTGTYVQYSADLNDFIGQTVYIGIRHYNVSDMFRVNVDQVEVWGENATVVPQGPYTVTFIDNLTGTTLSTQTVVHGNDAVAPEVPSHAGYTFIGWSTSFVGVTSNLIVYAMYRDNSANVDLNTMTVLMRAHYTTKQYTFITWHANNGSGEYKDSDRVLINENIPIEFPEADPTVSGGAKPGNDDLAWPDGGKLLWEDHVFLGWARVEIGNTANGVGAEYDPTNTAAYVKERSFNEDDLFLKYCYPEANEDEDEGHFEAKINNAWTEVEFVAADEVDPYHGMYAVWADVFYVYHSSDNTVQRVVHTNKAPTIDIAHMTKSGCLYGGYYTDYSGKSTRFDNTVARTLAWSTVTADTLSANNSKVVDTAKADPGSGKVAYTGVNNTGTNWVWTNACTASGLAVSANAGDVFYIKEVPADKYLQPYLHYTYKLDDNGTIMSAFAISDIDDLNYNQTGFIIVDDGHLAGVAKQVTVTTTGQVTNVTLKADELFGVGNSTATKNRLTYLKVFDIDDANSFAAFDGTSFTVLRYWKTPDGLYVTGVGSTTYSGTTANNIQGHDNPNVASVIDDDPNWAPEN